jgi:phosphoribosylformylglycinamidine cyclo-ligase
VSSNSEKTYTYKDAGVDIDAGDALVKAIKPLAASTNRLGANADLGGFGGLFDLKAAGYKDPILVAATDGVGTKLKLAIETGIFNTVGIDLVAMCVNDLVVQGAEPLMFLDYYATGHLDVNHAKDIIAGIAEGCKQSNCALIGGETAEMPGMYSDGDFDLAGFSVGAAERSAILDARNVAVGDVIIGLASSGVHSNGFSLVRRLLSDNNVDLSAPFPTNQSKSIGETILAPTKIYVKSLLKGLEAGHVKAMSHITGGGLLENIPRTMPDDTVAVLDASAWDLHPIYPWLQDLGNMEMTELARTFNCGIGMAVIVHADKVDEALALFKAEGETAYRIGDIVAGNGKPITRVTAPDGTWGQDKGWMIETARD